MIQNVDLQSQPSNFNNCDNIVTDNNGTSNCRFDSFSNSQTTENNKNDPEINVNIYRFKFTNEFTEELYKFSKIHQYDHRKDFKEAWKIWVDDQDNIVNEEMRRLVNLGYGGNVLDKMFKSARYYFRKKSTEKKEPAQRRVYRGSNKNLLEAMDSHIQQHITEKDFKPSDGFDSFCNEYLEIVKEEAKQLHKNGVVNSNEIKIKIKKTYKNRYYLFITK